MVIRITTITTTIATIIAAIPLIHTAVIGKSPAIELFKKTSIIISPTIQSGQRINTSGKEIIVKVR